MLSCHNTQIQPIKGVAAATTAACKLHSKCNQRAVCANVFFLSRAFFTQMRNNEPTTEQEN